MNIKVLVLDVGGVLIRWNLELWCAALARVFSVSPEQIHRLWTDPDALFVSFSRGAINASALHQELCARFRVNVSMQTFHEAWQREGDHAPEHTVIDHIRAIADQHDLTIISCTNIDPFLAMHHRHPGEALHELFDHEVQSWHPHIQSVKPEPRMYEIAIAYARQHVRAVPAQCIFIDDREENVRAAQSHGLHGIHYRCHRSLVRDLALHGLTLTEKLPRRT